MSSEQQDYKVRNESVVLSNLRVMSEQILFALSQQDIKIQKILSLVNQIIQFLESVQHNEDYDDAQEGSDAP